MSGTPREIRVALAAQLAGALGIRAYGVWPASILPPVAIVTSTEGDFEQSFSDQATHRMVVTVLLQLGRQEQAQEQMDGFIATSGGSSVRAAVEADPTVGGTADSALVKGYRDYGGMRVGEDPEGRGPEYLGCRFDVEVLA